MKRLIFTAAVIAAFSACSVLAEQDKDSKMVRCSVRGEVYSVAAAYRDEGHSPEGTYAMMLGFTNDSAIHGITANALKQIINQVYFDPGFTHARGFMLHSQMFHSCLENGHPGFMPLK